MQIRQRVRPWMLVSAIWIAPAALATITQVAQRRLHGEPPATLSDLIWAGGDWLVYAFLTPIVFWLSGRWPIARPHLVRRIALHLGISLLFCVGWATGGKLLQTSLGFIFTPDKVHAAMAAPDFWRRTGEDLLGWIYVTLPFGVVVYVTVTGMAHAIRYFVEVQEREVALARVSRQFADARLSALQAQLNPHFLFNTLNTIAVRARDGDGTGTARLVEQLSDVLRRTLNRGRANEVTLSEELELVEQYVAIEQARFPDRLRPTFDMDVSARGAAVPGFALQHLVENAIRHGVARRADAGRVTIRARRDGASLVLSVADDGPGIDTGAGDLKGHGIDNTRERLRALYGERATLHVARDAGGGTLATLRIPYRELVLETDRAPR